MATLKPSPKSAYQRGPYDDTTEGAAQFMALADLLGRQFDVVADASRGFLPIEVDDVQFLLLHGEAWGDENVAVMCDFGVVPKENRERVLEAALVVNHRVQGLWSPVFSIDEHSNSLVMVAVLPVFGLVPESLVSTLTNFSIVAHNWRETHFIRPVEI